MDFSQLVIGSIINVTLDSARRLNGELSGLKDEPKVIILKNVRFLHEANPVFGLPSWSSDIIFGHLVVDCKNISKVEILKVGENADLATPSTQTLAQDDSNQEVGKELAASLPWSSKTRLKKPSSLNWLPGSKSFCLRFQTDTRKSLNTSMDDYCKKLFENTNFVDLISSVKRPSEFRLPSYFAKIYREPSIPLECKELSIAESVEKQEAAHNNFEDNNEDNSDLNAYINFDDTCEMIIAEILNFHSRLNEEPLFSVHKQSFDIDNQNLYESSEIESTESNMSSPGPFLRNPNGEMYLNEEFFINLCGSNNQPNNAIQNES